MFLFFSLTFNISPTYYSTEAIVINLWKSHVLNCAKRSLKWMNQIKANISKQKSFHMCELSITQIDEWSPSAVTLLMMNHHHVFLATAESIPFRNSLLFLLVSIRSEHSSGTIRCPLPEGLESFFLIGNPISGGIDNLIFG